jgi:hypothetical protein
MQFKLEPFEYYLAPPRPRGGASAAGEYYYVTMQGLDTVSEQDELIVTQ